MNQSVEERGGRFKPGVDRRQVIHGLALALVGLNSSTLLANQSKPSPTLAFTAAEPDLQTNAPVTFSNAAELLHAIKTAPEEKAGRPGLYSLRLSDNSDYPVIGIRRTAPTSSEVHKGFTDVWYVLKGAGTLVTGGRVVEGVESPPGEIRGRSIAGGDARRVRGGDFAVIPAGVPHWISRVEVKELLYIVIKVPAKL